MPLDHIGYQETHFLHSCNCIVQVLDFGVVATNQRRTRVVTLYNSLEDPVAVLHIEPRESDKRVTVDFPSPVAVLPDQPFYFNVTYQSDDMAPGEPMRVSTGTLLIQTNSSADPTTKIRYKTTVIDGHLGYNESELFFLIGDEENSVDHVMSRSIKV